MVFVLHFFSTCWGCFFGLCIFVLLSGLVSVFCCSGKAAREFLSVVISACVFCFRLCWGLGFCRGIVVCRPSYLVGLDCISVVIFYLCRL